MLSDQAANSSPLEALSPADQMEIIEWMAQAMPIDIFPPVSLRKTYEVKEFDFEEWKARTGYKPA